MDGKDKAGEPATGGPAQDPRDKSPADRDRVAEQVKTDPPDFCGEKEPNPGHPV